jgi:hypothetical protein
MSDETPIDRAVIAIIERIAIAVEWTTRNTAKLNKQIKTTFRRLRQRLINLGRSRP